MSNFRGSREARSGGSPTPTKSKELHSMESVLCVSEKGIYPRTGRKGRGPMTHRTSPTKIVLTDRVAQQHLGRPERMVQFSLKLEDNRVDKWSAYYINYKKLKKAIQQVDRSRYAACESVPHRGITASLDDAQLGTIEDAKSSPRPTEDTRLLEAGTAHGIPALGGGRTLGLSHEGPSSSFERLLTHEIDKVEGFFVKELAVLREELSALDPIVASYENSGLSSDESSLSHSKGERGSHGSPGPWVMRANLHLDRKEEDSLKRAVLELYRDLTLLQNFAIVNYTAVVKITKKYDKHIARLLGYAPGVPLAPSAAITPRALEYVRGKDFYTVSRLKSVVSACEAFFAGVFCGGNVTQARGLLLPQKIDERIDLAQFQIGYRMGIAAVLAFWIMWDCCFEPHRENSTLAPSKSSEHVHTWKVSVLLQPAFPVYRAMAGVLLLRWCWGLSSLVWARARINYIYLFDMDPRAVYAPLEVFNNVAAETVIYLANLLVYYKLLVHRFPRIMPPGCLPLILCAYIMCQMLSPLRKSWEFWRVFFRVLAAPLVKVDFFSTYVADVMTSSVKTTQDMAWSLCFFLSGDFLLTIDEYHLKGAAWQRSSLYVNLVLPALCVLPLWLRFMQCIRRYNDTQKRFPHLANCLKYSMAFTVALFGVFTPPHSTTTAVKIGWFAMYVVSTLYTFAWDVLQDWGLGRPRYGFLRKKRLFARSWVYYAAVVADLILRFNWLYSLIPPGHNPLPFLHSSTLPVFVTTVVIVLEFLRRTMWGFFRVENEHLDNTEGYRSTDHVPLHFTTTNARTNAKPKNGAVVIGEVVGVTAAGIATAALAIVVARDQASP